MPRTIPNENTVEFSGIHSKCISTLASLPASEPGWAASANEKKILSRILIAHV
jgi:hypothetical protein